MIRIICDTYTKGDKHLWGDNPHDEFNQRIDAVNRMYGWLYEKGILNDVSFEFKDYEDAVYFAVDAKDLEPYRKEMEAAQIEGAALATRHIFDQDYTPCTYSGAIELGWTMMSYRDVDGCVGRSWECGLVKGLNTEGIYTVAKVRDEYGPKAAVKALFAQFDWDLTLPEQERYRDALNYFQKTYGADLTGLNARELLYCYENGKDLLDYDFWTRYQTLCDEKMTFEEYVAIDSEFDGDPHDIEESDLEAISEIKASLNRYRALQKGETIPKENRQPDDTPSKPPLTHRLEDASVRSAAPMNSEPLSKNVADSVHVTLTKEELDLIKESLDVRGNQQADREGYSSGEPYWDLKEKLDRMQITALDHENPGLNR